MRYFIDTEFIDGKIIDLISIDIVSENNRTYYAINQDCDYFKASKWVKENIIYKLKSYLTVEEYYKLYKNKNQIKQDIIEFIDDKPEFWGYYSAYDWVVFCQLFGDLPKHFPIYCRDLKQLLDDRGNPKIPFESTSKHNALCDAIWNKQVYDWLMN